MFLDGFKIRGRDGGGVAMWENLLDFGAHGFEAILKGRKRAKDFWDVATACWR